MHKEQFLKELQQHLSQLPPEEIRTRLDFYEEMIADRMEDGMTEEQAVSALGDPEQAARQILEEIPMATLVKTRVRPRKGWSPAAVVLVIAGAPLWIPLVLAGLSVAGAVLLTFWSLGIAVYGTTLGLGAGGIGALILSLGCFRESLGTGLLAAGTGFLLLGLCCLGIFLGVWVTKFLISGTKWMYYKGKSLFIKV